MGNTIILCEGETDQALLGCYLERMAKWTYSNNIKDNPFPKEPISWFINKGGSINGIWQIGGNDFSEAINTIANREHFEHLIDAIVIITDHDDLVAENERLKYVKMSLDPILNKSDGEQIVLSNRWNTLIVDNEFSTSTIHFLYLLVPIEEFGALETFMMNAIAEQNVEKKEVIDQSRDFIRNFRSDYYLKQRREKVKAELGVSLSVFSPDRIFTTMKELIDSVEWEKLSTTHKQFDLLKQLWSDTDG